MDTVTIELTKEEAQLLPLLYKVRLHPNTTLEAAPEIVKTYKIVDGLIEKVNKAFNPPAPPAV